MMEMVFPCNVCPASYKKKNNLQRHYKSAHPNTEIPTSIKQRSSKRIACPILQCKDLFARPEELEEHLNSDHDIETGEGIEHFKTFKSKEDFFRWKNEIEKSTNSRYVKRNLSKRWSSGELRQRYHCHRSGKVIVKLVDRQRRMRQHGSAKIGKECPAAIVAIFHQDKGVSVSYNLEHCGHALDPVYVSSLERDMIIASATLSDAKICRLCAQSVKDGKPLFSEECADLLQQCHKVFPFELMNDGKHPVLICEECEMEMQMISGFIDKVIAAQSSLQKMICNRVRRILKRSQKYLREKRGAEDLEFQPKRKRRKNIENRTTPVEEKIKEKFIWQYNEGKHYVTATQDEDEPPSFSSNSTGKYFVECTSQPEYHQPKLDNQEARTSKTNVDQVYVIVEGDVFPAEATPSTVDDSLKVLIEAADLVNQRP